MQWYFHKMSFYPFILMEGRNPENPKNNPRNKDENQQQSQSTYDVSSGNRTLVRVEHSNHCASAAPQLWKTSIFIFMKWHSTCMEILGIYPSQDVKKNNWLRKNARLSIPFLLTKSKYRWEEQSFHSVSSFVNHILTRHRHPTRCNYSAGSTAARLFHLLTTLHSPNTKGKKARRRETVDESSCKRKNN